MTKLHSQTLAETGFASRVPAPKSMKRLANMITAGAIAVSLLLASAVPVRAAGRDDLAKALIAAIVIGALLNSAKKSHADPAPAPQPVQRPRLPDVCAIDLDSQRRVFSGKCLQREGFDHNLPQRCASEARIYGRPDRIFGADCLRGAGFRVSGR